MSLGIFIALRIKMNVIPSLKTNTITSIWRIKTFLFCIRIKGFRPMSDGSQWREIDFTSLISNFKQYWWRWEQGPNKWEKRQFRKKQLVSARLWIHRIRIHSSLDQASGCWQETGMTSFVIPDFLYSDNAAILFRWEDKFDLLLYYWNSSQETKR